jgi:GrxC family glutaredoxin
LSKIEVYTTTYCPYCRAAEALLDKKNVDYKKIDVTHDPQLKRRVMEEFRWRTVPIIIIDDNVIGGYYQLAALESASKLDKILNHASEK